MTESGDAADQSIRMQPSAIGAGFRKVRCIGHVYSHHAKHSGYHHLARYVGGEWAPSTLVRALGETALRIPAKLYAQRCGVYEYSRHSVISELEVLARAFCGDSTVWHHLYGEKTFLLSSRLRALRRDRQVATFHHHPLTLRTYLGSTRHLRHLDHAIAMSSVQVEFLEALVGQGRVTVVPHGVDTEFWHPTNLADDGACRLLFAGTHMRDFETLERVVKRVLEWRRDVEFVLISSDLRCARIAGQRRVRWLYRVPDALYRHELQRASLLVLPLLHSTAVNVVLEALACGVPVVTTEGGVSDYVDEKCSITVSSQNSERILEAIGSLLESKRLPLMKHAARKRAQEFSWTNIAERTRTIYRAVAE